LTIDEGVYQTAGDSELMAEVVQINNSESFLEIGCGSGFISLVLAKKGLNGVGVDINSKAVGNSIKNAKDLDIQNVSFFRSDVFENVRGTFDIIVCNPPYSEHEVTSDIDRMFWDSQNKMKKNFFVDVDRYLKTNGAIYFGWANFADIDVDLPLKLAKQHGLALINIWERPDAQKRFSFFVLQFTRSH
jgi:release factor glutamine methyltransferase